jgi:hypothetical protein
MIEYVGYGIAIIAGISWLRWFWQGYAYRGGFQSPILAIAWTVLAIVILK